MVFEEEIPVYREESNMIYVTGDTHGKFMRFYNKKLACRHLEFTKDDYIIICGDFGLCWADDREFRYQSKLFSERQYTTLWVQGNHENYDMIKKFPLEEWHGGMVRHIVRDKVILLERGQVFTIDKKKFFTFGGASSHDIQGGILDRTAPDFKIKRDLAKSRKLPYRIIHESWWEEELPSEAEMQTGRENLAKHGYKVDYVITHCCPTRIQDEISYLSGRRYEPDILTDYLQDIDLQLQYNRWFFGHYHGNMDIDGKYQLLYTAIIPVV